MFFSRYKSLSNADIHRAVVLSCMVLTDVCSARYFLYNNSLVVVYLDNTNNIDSGLQCKNSYNILLKNLPSKYRENVVIWDSVLSVPEDVLKTTGYVYFHRKEQVVA